MSVFGNIMSAIFGHSATAASGSGMPTAGGTTAPAADTPDSASMNVWLHKQVMAKLAANGGKLPPEIKH